jgi:hypothetical protein
LRRAEASSSALRISQIVASGLLTRFSAHKTVNMKNM